LKSPWLHNALDFLLPEEKTALPISRHSNETKEKTIEREKKRPTSGNII